MLTIAPEFNTHTRSLVQKYFGAGPRYTSYPTAADFHTDVDADVYCRALRGLTAAGDQSLSLYVHIPFCAKRCRFCACSVVASPRPDKVSTPYIDALLTEFSLVSQRLPERCEYAQLHFGGGTPTYLSSAELRCVVEGVQHHFNRAQNAECSIELDPRVTSIEHIDTLADLGFRRISLGVQDFDPHVQDAIGRHQSFEATQTIIAAARDRKIREINLDLVYGLPRQTVSSIDQTVQHAIALKPSRVALYSYAHIPAIRGNQRAIDPSDLPAPEQKIEQLLLARRRFLEAGYIAIGMDHFALPEDPLARALTTQTLHRDFMGYSTHAGTNILGFGMTAIGELNGTMVQNPLKLAHYQQAMRDGKLSTVRGLVRSFDDRVRQAVIQDLMCRFEVDFADIESKFSIASFEDYFSTDLMSLSSMIEDGLILQERDRLRVTSLGSLFVRNIAMGFDARLQTSRAKTSATSRILPRFSSTI